MLNSYRMNYYPQITWINMNSDPDFRLLTHYNYLLIKFKVYAPDKTRVPAIAIKFMVFGVGFVFFTHARK